MSGGATPPVESSAAPAITLPGPAKYVDLYPDEPGESAPLWELRGAVLDQLGNWVRAGTATTPLEIAGGDFGDADLADVEHDLLALLAAVRASRAAHRHVEQSAPAHFCHWCGGNPLPDGQPCPTIDLDRQPTDAEADELRAYYQQFSAHPAGGTQ